jgi:uncharacterized membrane-anchored protein
MTMLELMLRNHPQRDMAEKELQQRFFPALTAPCQICHFMLTVNAASRDSEFAALKQLANAQQVPFHETDTDLSLAFAEVKLRYERHSEFSTYSFIRPGPSLQFSQPQEFLPFPDFFQQIPGQLFRVVQLNIVNAAREAPAEGTGQLTTLAPLMATPNWQQYFASEHCISSLLCNQQAQVWTDFRKHPEGGGRMLLMDFGLSASALARLVQQLFDLGKYRKLSLLSWPLVRQSLSRLHQLEQQLSDITQRIEQQQGSDEQLLREITQMTAQTEHLIANNSARIEASAAYYQLTLDRLKSLRETPVDGMMSLQDFSERRLTPAFRTAQSVLSRQLSLSNRLGRSTELLRTRVNLQLERQNTELLASMEQRARLQLSLQTAVERLSVVALSYYAVQLVDKALYSIHGWFAQLPLQLLQTLSLPAVIVIVAWLLYRLRRAHQQH